ncbi:MAG TPA: hypothetical protein VGN81_08845 [Pseudonocardiaceae bacterium]|jgi:hypothetical protein
MSLLRACASRTALTRQSVVDATVFRGAEASRLSPEPQVISARRETLVTEGSY